MQFYFAPLEGITDHIFRSLHHKYFPGIHRYYTPFLSPTVHRRLTAREAREIPPADTLDYTVVPQLLTKVPEDFLFMAQVCKDLGYKEVNLNLGCPSGTVTAKGKGAGMLRDLNALDDFLSSIYSANPVDISVKTRLGFESAQEFPAILGILNRYPVKELTLHPRVRKAFYNGKVDMDAFTYAYEHSKAPLCYNGNLCSVSDIDAFTRQYPKVKAVMLGRGLIGDPGMLCPGGRDIQTLKSYHRELSDYYVEAFGGARNAMFRLKEHWRYLLCLFEGSEKLGKRLRKTTDINEYQAITQEIFRLPMRKELHPDW